MGEEREGLAAIRLTWLRPQQGIRLRVTTFPEKSIQYSAVRARIVSHVGQLVERDAIAIARERRSPRKPRLRSIPSPLVRTR
jgi:hypothetical protein